MHFNLNSIIIYLMNIFARLALIFLCSAAIATNPVDQEEPREFALRIRMAASGIVLAEGTFPEEERGIVLHTLRSGHRFEEADRALLNLLPIEGPESEVVEQGAVLRWGMYLDRVCSSETFNGFEYKVNGLRLTLDCYPELDGSGLYGRDHVPLNELPHAIERLFNSSQGKTNVEFEYIRRDIHTDGTEREVVSVLVYTLNRPAFQVVFDVTPYPELVQATNQFIEVVERNGIRFSEVVPLVPEPVATELVNLVRLAAEAAEARHPGMPDASAVAARMLEAMRA